MRFAEVFSIAFDTLWRNKLRSFLTLLGVIFGVAAVIVVASSIEGFNVSIDQQIDDIGTNALSVQKFAIEDFASLDSFLEASRRNPDVRAGDAEAIRNLAPLVDKIRVRARTIAEVKYGNEVIQAVQTQGAPANAIDIDRFTVESGRFFFEQEDLKSREVVFIGHDVADRFFPTGDPVGKSIKIDGRPYTVIGVAKSQGSVFGQSRDAFVIIPITTFLETFGSRRSLTILVTSRDQESYAATVDQVRSALRVRRQLSPNERENFGIMTPDAINELRDNIFGTIQTTTIGVTAISLIVGGIGIMNIMLVSVTERTREIGIRLAIGALERQVLTQFLVEAVVLSLLGGLLGTLLGLGLAWLATRGLQVPFTVDPTIVLVAFAFSALVGIIFGYFPARRAARLDPIEALRHE